MIFFVEEKKAFWKLCFIRRKIANNESNILFEEETIIYEENIFLEYKLQYFKPYFCFEEITPILKEKSISKKNVNIWFTINIRKNFLYNKNAI